MDSLSATETGQYVLIYGVIFKSFKRDTSFMFAKGWWGEDRDLFFRTVLKIIEIISLLSRKRCHCANHKSLFGTHGRGGRCEFQTIVSML